MNGTRVTLNDSGHLEANSPLVSPGSITGNQVGFELDFTRFTRISILQLRGGRKVASRFWLEHSASLCSRREFKPWRNLVFATHLVNPDLLRAQSRHTSALCWRATRRLVVEIFEHRRVVMLRWAGTCRMKFFIMRISLSRRVTSGSGPPIDFICNTSFPLDTRKLAIRQCPLEGVIHF